jgi:hypothetical protein
MRQQAAPNAVVADSTPASGPYERDAKGQKRHEGGCQRDKGTPRPAQTSWLEEESQHHEGKIDSGHEGQELIFGHSPLCREVADAECRNQDVEHQHDRVQQCDEQPAVNGEPIKGDGTDAVPR